GSRNTRNKCSPSSTHCPVFARSRDDATKRIACLTGGLSADVTRGTAMSRDAYAHPRHPRVAAIGAPRDAAVRIALIDALARRVFSGAVRKEGSTRCPGVAGRTLRLAGACPDRTARALRPPRIPA